MSRFFAKLSRRTTSGSFIPEIDGIRFVSIALVVLYHAHVFIPSEPRVVTAIGEHGFFGVKMFFALSGFILGLPFAEQFSGTGRRVELGRYFLRRLTRLEPPYIINLLIWFAIKVVVLHRAIGFLLPHMMASVTYTHNLIYLAPSEINYYAWSLEVEVQFYLLAPLLAAVFRVRSRRLRLGVLAAAITLLSLRSLFFDVKTLVFLELTLLGEAEWFLLGFVLVDIYLVDWKRAPVTSGGWDLVSLLAWPSILALLYVPGAIPQFTWLSSSVLPWVLLLAYIGAFRGKRVRSFFRLRPVFVIGGMCYSIYLYHGYVVTSVAPLLNRIFTGGGWLEAVLKTACVFAAVATVGALAFVLFERPFMNPSWFRSIWSRATPRRVSAPASRAAEPSADS